ncbi:MAG: glycine--tRNA ligase [Candidatus Gygaella obscura]|nr:glycine--tRNA ligase [Candidatus Gygaella obscura]
MEKIVSLCKRRGFIFQGSEAYGGLANAWDYGPLGVELKNNIKSAWWKNVVSQRGDIFGLDAAIFMHPDVWKASGHANNFTDNLVDCKNCKKRFKLDDLKIEKCPECGGELTQGKKFNLMLETHLGPVDDSAAKVYLRPETAQGIFVNFLNVLNSARPKLPFGIAQIGKAFRNEITPGNFIFRTREFEQMEIEYFVNPKEADKFHKNWIDERFVWYKGLGIKDDNLRLRVHEKDELAHYAKGCTDIEYKFPFGWSELEGIANRGDFDLKQHSEHSAKTFEYFNTADNEKVVPYVIEPSGGVDRTVLAVLVDSYHEEKVKEQIRVVLKLDKKLAPIKVAVLPLLKKNSDIVKMSHAITDDLKTCFTVKYNDTASIGKLYRRQDEVGTPYCVTVDVDSLTDKKVTIRDRDTMAQDRVGIDNLKNYLFERLI